MSLGVGPMVGVVFRCCPRPPRTEVEREVEKEEWCVVYPGLTKM